MGEGRAHDEIFRDGDGHVVAPMPVALETPRQLDDEWFARFYDRAQLGEDFEMRIDLAHAEGAACGVCAYGKFFQAAEQRGVEQDRGSHVLGELVVGERVFEG